MPTLNFDDIVSLWNAAGGNPDMGPLMAGIALAESGGDTTSLFDNPPTGDYSVGLWQINYFGSLGPARTSQFGSPQYLQGNPPAQATAAVNLSGNSFANVASPGPWTNDPCANQWIANGRPQGHNTPNKQTVQAYLAQAGKDQGNGASAGAGATGTSGIGGTSGTTGSVGSPITPPPPGLSSDIARDSFIINGSPLSVDISDALVDASMTLDASQASVLELVIHDPTRQLLNTNSLFSQQSVLNLDGGQWQMVAVAKQQNLLTVTFEPWVIAALRSDAAQSPFSVPPGTMTRTSFARQLVNQVQGATFVSPPFLWLYTLDSGYAHDTQEQLSRGTTQNPHEDSWACLQRLASEIGWRCFEYYGNVYFGPDEWLVTLPAAAALQEWTGGVLEIDGDYDVGQPLGQLTVNALVGSYMPVPGQCVTVSNLGPLSSQHWLVSTVERPSLFHPEVTLTLQTPQPNLPEPASGGAAAATNVAGQVVPTAGGKLVAPNGTGVSIGRTDQGVDFTGSGPLLAIGSGKIVLAGYDMNGWGPPNGESPGGVVLLQLDTPPDPQHSLIYYAEGLDASVAVGQHVNAGDTVAQANGNSVEIGFANPNNTSAVQPLSQVTGQDEGQHFKNYITTGSL